MKGSEDEMPRFRRRQCRIHGLPVAHFADKQYIRVLAQRFPYPFGKGLEVNPIFPLADKGQLPRHDIFNGIFQRNDVAAAVGIRPAQYSP